MATLPRANSAECPNRTDIHNQNPPRSEPQAPSTTAQNCKTTTGITSARIAHISHTDPKKLNPPPKFDPGKFPELSVDPTAEIYPPGSKFRGNLTTRHVCTFSAASSADMAPRSPSSRRSPVSPIGPPVHSWGDELWSSASLSLLGYLWLVGARWPERCEL